VYSGGGICEVVEKDLRRSQVKVGVVFSSIYVLYFRAGSYLFLNYRILSVL
jgi:hypothetical protein